MPSSREVSADGGNRAAVTRELTPLLRGIAHRSRTVATRAATAILDEIRVPGRTWLRAFVADRWPGLARRSYEGAAVGRRGDGWVTSNASANAEIRGGLKRLRARSRDLARNNPLAARTIGSLTSYLVGCGIRPQPRTGDPALDAQALALWRAWEDRADAAGMLTFGALQSLAVRGWLESGESLVRRVPRKSRDKLPVPLQIDVIEGDFIDGERDRLFQSGVATGDYVVQGVQFDNDGRRMGYWLFGQHPGDTLIMRPGAFQSMFYPLDDVAHLYRPTRPGQVRGVPWLAPVMMDLRDLDDYDDAERMRKKIESCLVAFVLGSEQFEEGIASQVTNAAGDVIERFEPGMVVNVRGGKDVKMSQPAGTGGATEYVRAQQHTIAAGLEMPYELVTGDLSQVNYSSIRYGMLTFRRLVDSLQEHVIIPNFCAPIWRWFVDAALASGALPERRPDGSLIEWRAMWDVPAWEEIDAEKEARAAVLSMRAGIKSLRDVHASLGLDTDEVLRATAQVNSLADSLGLVLSGDGRKPEAGGMAQPMAAQSAKQSPDQIIAGATQDVSLNGAQVTSLVAVITAVAAGTLPADAAKALIAEAFPNIDPAKVDTMVDAASNFTPAAAPPPP